MFELSSRSLSKLEGVDDKLVAEANLMANIVNRAGS